MEYGQELDKTKTEVANSEKKQESINNFQDNNALNRIETKIDILAQIDYSELFNFSLDNLKNDLTGDIELINAQINYISQKLNDNNISTENETTENFSDSSLLEDLNFLKENFYKINEKFSEITHLIRTNTAENEELNNRFESNLTSFNSNFQNIYEQFNNFENTFKSSFSEFKTCINDIYDQFSTIDNRSDLDQVKFYVQSFNNKILSIAEILETLKENNFSIKVDNYADLIEENTQETNKKLDFIIDETKSFSNRLSDEFSSLVSPLSSAIELLCGLKDSVPEELDLLKNDITEISSKINKVILNEKEDSNLLNSSFNDLKEEINKNLESNIENSNQNNEKVIKKLSDELKSLNKKIDKTEEISSNTLEITEDVKNAIVYMAEWFDSASKLIEENNKNSKKNSIELEKTDSLIKRSEENITEQIKRISDRLNRFEIRMESIEGKIEKLYGQHSNREVLNILSDILEKVEISNERSKSNELIINKLKNLELKIQEFENKKTVKSRKKLFEENF